MLPQLAIIGGLVAFAAACLLIVKSAGKSGDYRPVTQKSVGSPVFFVLLVIFFVGLLFLANTVTGGMVAAALAG